MTKKDKILKKVKQVELFGNNALEYLMMVGSYSYEEEAKCFYESVSELYRIINEEL